jgi:inner membrane protein YidH
LTTPETKSANESAEQQTNLAAKPTKWGRIRAAIHNWWNADATDPKKKSSGELAEVRTDLAVTRTLMAADRTLMAWIRTALSLLSFGFTIYKVLQGFQDAGSLAVPAGETPRNIGLFLTGMGTVAMVMGTIEYVQTLKMLHHHQHFRLARPPMIMALLMSVTGLFLFFSIITKLF